MSHRAHYKVVAHFTEQRIDKGKTKKLGRPEKEKLNKRIGWNKRIGRPIREKLINV